MKNAVESIKGEKHGDTSFEKKNSAWVSRLNTGLISEGWYGMFFAGGIWCLADVSSVSPSSEQTQKRYCT